MAHVSTQIVDHRAGIAQATIGTTIATEPPVLLASMRRVALIGTLTIYDVCLGAGFLIPVGTAIRLALQSKWSVARVLITVALAGGATIAGARLTYILTRWSDFASRPIAAIIAPDAGFVLSGGLALGAGIGFLSARALGLDAWRLADGLAPGIGVAIAVARFGCFWQGCCYGKETRLPWGVCYPAASSPYMDQVVRGRLFLAKKSLPVHPTQLYELLGALIGAAGAAYLAKAGRCTPGTAGLVFAGWFCTVHGLNHVLRAAGSIRREWAWILPGIDVVLGLTALVLLFLRRRVALATCPTRFLKR